MNRNLIKAICLFWLLFCISCSSASEQNTEVRIQNTEATAKNSELKTQNSTVDSILDKLNKSTQELKSYQCEIEYKYVQPSVFDAQTIRKGMLYYSKNTEYRMQTRDASSVMSIANKELNTHDDMRTTIAKLRVNFQTLQQDEDKEQKYEEQYIIVDGASLVSRASSLVLSGKMDDGREITDERRFEGLWLVQLDYNLKNCKYIQLALYQSGSGLTDAGEPNKPMDVFELISTKLPIVGFSKTDRLKEEFEISLSPRGDTSDGLIQVQLKVKPNSVYKDDYVQIDCVIDEKLNLPVKITAISTEPEGETPESKDLYEIKFINAKVNEKLDEKVFDFQIPKDFNKPDVYPLEN